MIVFFSFLRVGIFDNYFIYDKELINLIQDIIVTYQHTYLFIRYNDFFLGRLVNFYSYNLKFFIEFSFTRL